VDSEASQLWFAKWFFSSDEQIRKLRPHMRLRDNLAVEGTQAIHHMQKALFEMNATEQCHQ
jgi:hypothetical protein